MFWLWYLNYVVDEIEEKNAIKHVDNIDASGIVFAFLATAVLYAIIMIVVAVIVNWRYSVSDKKKE